MADFRSLVEKKLEPVGETGNDTIYRCPQCEGSTGSGHLYVDYSKGYFNCFKCSFKGRRIESLLRYLHIDINFDYSKLYDERESILDRIISQQKVSVKPPVEYSTDLDVLTEYYYQHTTDLTHDALDYLLRRGLSYQTVAGLGIKLGVSRYGDDLQIKGKSYKGRDYSDRVLVPSIRKDGRVSFYVARDITGTKDPKYLNPPKELAVASEDVWSLDIIDTKSLIICEGVFTAIAVNQAVGKISACATYGKSIAKRSSSDSNVLSQGEKLLNRGFQSYIVFYDKDAKQESYDTAKYLHDRGANVRVVRVPDDMYGPKADAADMTADEVRYLILSSEEINKFSGLL